MDKEEEQEHDGTEAQIVQDGVFQLMIYPRCASCSYVIIKS